MTVVPRRFASPGAIARAITSLLAPAENGTTILIKGGNLASVCATTVVTADIAANNSAMRANVFLIRRTYLSG